MIATNAKMNKKLNILKERIQVKINQKKSYLSKYLL
jgi:hypothetical protein